MSVLLEIQKQLGVANERVSRLERALRDYPKLPSVAANLDSAVRVRENLRMQFDEAAERAGYDIISYRAFDDRDDPKAAKAFRAIVDFQSLVSVVYSAVSEGHRKERATIPEAAQKESSFDFGYAIAGSVKVVLTLRNQKWLLGETPLDETIGVIITLAKSKTPEEVQEHARVLGPGVINALYQWADGNANAGLGAEIEWRKGSAVQRSAVIQRQEVRALRTAIYDTTLETHETIKVKATLVAADLQSKRFKLEREGLPTIAGTFEIGVINNDHKASLPSAYIARLQKTSKTRRATGAEEVRWHLIELKNVPSGQTEE